MNSGFLRLRTCLAVFRHSPDHGTGRTYGQYVKLEKNKLRFFVAAEDN